MRLPTYVDDVANLLSIQDEKWRREVQRGRVSKEAPIIVPDEAFLKASSLITIRHYTKHLDSSFLGVDRSFSSIHLKLISATAVRSRDILVCHCSDTWLESCFRKRIEPE